MDKRSRMRSRAIVFAVIVKQEQIRLPKRTPAAESRKHAKRRGSGRAGLAPDGAAWTNRPTRRA
jgi:hypothetical protein